MRKPEDLLCIENTLPDGFSGRTLWRKRAVAGVSLWYSRHGFSVDLLRRDEMAVWMAGVDHTRADLDVRSVFSFTKKRIEQLYIDLRGTHGIEGCILMSTCNRMEIWFSVNHRADFTPMELLCDYIGVKTERYAPFFVERRGREAVDHLFRVAAGLESRIVGEDQIVTQVGDALALARSCYAADHTLEVLFRLAVTAAKRVKTEAHISSADQSVIHTALKNLAEEGLSVEGKRCMVIGNGMMGRLSAQTLMDHGADVTVTVRQYHRGVVDIPMHAKRINYIDRLEFLPGCDYVVSATSSPNYTLQLKDLEPLKPDHPIRLIDLAVPRDIDPLCKALDWVRLYDIDSFHVDHRSERLTEALVQAQAILDEEEERFYSWYGGKDFIPQIQRIKEAAGADAAARMTPALRKARLGEERKQQLSREAEGAAERMLNHLLHGMRGRMDDDTFRKCLNAMDEVLCADSPGTVRTEDMKGITNSI
jgi:glutamyl-tRNA reductase